MSAIVIKFPGARTSEVAPGIETRVAEHDGVSLVEVTFHAPPGEVMAASPSFTAGLGLHTAKSLRDALDTLIASAEEGAVS